MLKKVLAVAGGIVLLGLAVIALVVLGYDFNHLKAPAVRAVEQATGRRLALDGNVRVALGLSPALVIEEVRLANAAWGSRPDMLQLRRVEVQVALIPLIRGRIEVRRFVLIEPRVWIETDARGRSNLEFTPPDDTGPSSSRRSPGTSLAGPAAAGLAFYDLQIRNATVNFQDGSSGRVRQCFVRELRTAMENRQGFSSLSASGQVDGEPFSLDGQLGPLEALLDPAVPWPLKLQGRFVDIDARVDGRILDPLRLQGVDLAVAVKAPGLSRAAAFAGRSLPLEAPLEARGQVGDTGPRTWRVAGFTLTLGASDLQGELTLDLAAPRPRLEAELASRLLDLHHLAAVPAAAAPIRSPGSGAPAEPHAGRVFSEAPIQLPLELLEALDARILLRAQRVMPPAPVELRGLEATADLAQGRLTLAPFRAQVASGTLEGRLILSAVAGRPALQLWIEGAGLDLEASLGRFWAPHPLEGNADLWAEVKTSGSSPAALMAGLDGHVGLAVARGRIPRTLLDRIGADIGASLLRILDPAARGAVATDLNCAVARLDLGGGIADATVLVLDTERMTLVGEGKVDLRTEALDLALRPIPKEGLAVGRFGTLGMSLGELTRTLRLGGTLARPALALDPSRAVLTLGKALGGAALLGPAGVGAALLGSRPADPDPCSGAIAAARTGRAPSVPEPKPSDQAPVRQLEQIFRGLLGR
jgi:uncharacterized protein involved in outer membrane biogenesis